VHSGVKSQHKTMELVAAAAVQLLVAILLLGTTAFEGNAQQPRCYICDSEAQCVWEGVEVGTNSGCSFWWMCTDPFGCGPAHWGHGWQLQCSPEGEVIFCDQHFALGMTGQINVPLSLAALQPDEVRAKVVYDGDLDVHRLICNGAVVVGVPPGSGAVPGVRTSSISAAEPLRFVIALAPTVSGVTAE